MPTRTRAWNSVYRTHGAHARNFLALVARIFRVEFCFLNLEIGAVAVLSWGNGWERLRYGWLRDEVVLWKWKFCEKTLLKSIHSVYVSAVSKEQCVSLCLMHRCCVLFLRDRRFPWFEIPWELSYNLEIGIQKYIFNSKIQKLAHIAVERELEKNSKQTKKKWLTEPDCIYLRLINIALTN